MGRRVGRVIRSWAKPRHVLAFVLTVLVVIGLDAGFALADSLSVSAQPSAVVWTGSEQPTMTVTGNAPPQYLWVSATVHPPGSGGCGPTASSDSGYALIGGEAQQSPDGSFTASAQLADGTIGDPGPNGPGTYVLCAWIQHADGSTFGPASTTLVVRRPQASLTLSPVSATPGIIHLTATYSLETGSAFLDVMSYDDFSGQKPCPAEGGQVPNALAPLSGIPIGGNKPLSGTLSANAGGPGSGVLLAPGRWRVCGYVSYGGLAAVGVPIQGVLASSSAVVVVPPVPKGACIVPNLKGLKLPAARKLLKQTHCNLGKVKPGKQHRRRTSRVISQSLPSGTVLRPGGRVSVVLAG